MADGLFSYDSSPDDASRWREADVSRTSVPPRPARTRRLLERACDALASRHAHAVIIALTLITSAPMFWLAFDADDYFQIASLSDSSLAGVERAPWDLYAFAKDRASNVALREEGVWPWWSDTEVLVSFFRPLASLSRWLDHALWPHSIPLMQLHSLLWFSLLLVAVSRLYQRLVPLPWVAALGLFLFASDEARAPTLAWLCNRNALISLALGFFALLLHVRARADGDRRAALLAPVCFALALLGGETALQAGGYLLAYTLVLDRGARASRVLSLAPYGAIVLAWGVVYKLLGYGAQGTAYYLDPVREPLAFARVVPERLAIYALSLFEGGSSDLFDLLPMFGLETRTVQLPLAIVGAALIVLALGPLVRRDALVRFWALGTLLATLPVCGVKPSDRVLTGAALGGMALLATLLASLVAGTYPRRPRRWLLVYGVLLALVNLVYAPLMRPLFIAMNDDFDPLLERADASIPRTPEVRDQTVVLVNPPWDTFAMFIPLYREAHGTPRPKHFRWLATGVTALEVRRVDAQSLAIAPDGGFLSSSSQQVLRSLDRPLRMGEHVRLEGMDIEVLSMTPDARPAEILVRFDQPLESRSLRLMRWGAHEYVPFQPPAIGESVTLPAVNLPAALSGA